MLQGEYYQIYFPQLIDEQRKVERESQSHRQGILASSSEVPQEGIHV